MASVFVNVALAAGVFVCFSFLVCGAGVLVCFVVGELQRIGRTRANRRKEALYEDLAAAKAREEVLKRQARLKKERIAAKKMRDEEVLEFEEIRKQVLDGAE